MSEERRDLVFCLDNDDLALERNLEKKERKYSTGVMCKVYMHTRWLCKVFPEYLVQGDLVCKQR